jgi:hypothetical protein
MRPQLASGTTLKQKIISAAVAHHLSVFRWLWTVWQWYWLNPKQPQHCSAFRTDQKTSANHKAQGRKCNGSLFWIISRDEVRPERSGFSAYNTFNDDYRVPRVSGRIRDQRIIRCCCLLLSCHWALLTAAVTAVATYKCPFLLSQRFAL